MDTGKKATLLKQVEFFAGCTDAQLQDIAKQVGARDLDDGEVLCRQGDHESEVFVIVRGEASVTINGSNVATIGPGEVVGELSMERGGQRTATLTAITPLFVLVLDPREIESVLMVDPKSERNLGPRHPG